MLLLFRSHMLETEIQNAVNITARKKKLLCTITQIKVTKMRQMCVTEGKRKSEPEAYVESQSECNLVPVCE